MNMTPFCAIKSTSLCKGYFYVYNILTALVTVTTTTKMVPITGLASSFLGGGGGGGGGEQNTQTYQLPMVTTFSTDYNYTT